MEKTIGLLKNNWQWMSLLGAILGVGMTIGIWFNNQNTKMDELQKTSLQALIFSNAPLIQRTETCDDYLKEGFDSYTKDFCNKLLEKAEYNLSMADEESVFILEGK